METGIIEIGLSILTFAHMFAYIFKNNKKEN